MAPSWASSSVKYFAWVVCVVLYGQLLFNMCVSSRQNACFCLFLYALHFLILSHTCYLEVQNGLKPCVLTEMLKSALSAACRSCQTKHRSNPATYSKCVFRRGETLVFLVRFYVCKSRLAQTSGFLQSERPTGRKARTARQPRRGDTSRSKGI